MTHDGGLGAGRHADTESFYMGGRQLAALSRRLIDAGWPAQTPAVVVSRAGWPDQIATDHCVATLGDATVLHAGRPTIVTVGVGAAAIERAVTAPGRSGEHRATLPSASAMASAGCSGRVASTP